MEPTQLNFDPSLLSLTLLTVLKQDGKTYPGTYYAHDRVKQTRLLQNSYQGANALLHGCQAD